MSEGTRRLGPYEIHSRIGSGGMGEVWKAVDTRLGRAVAVKILPAEFAANASLRSRFEREARTISQLHHPHICTLFDVGENYLVMELLEGQTLAERLAKGPMPLAEVLRYGGQMADALDKAHRQGVVHRDVKPGNVMITKAGAKLLDFGLAKAAQVELSLDGATEHRPLTQEGTILGTFQYMSPEQLEGQGVDHRADIFALGAVLYEMMTGRRAFDGKTKTSLIAAIVAAEPPPLSRIQPLTPPALEHVIQKCLAKDPEARWQSAHDIADELRWIGEQGSQAGAATPVTAPTRIGRGTLLAAAAVGWLLALAGAYGLWKSRERIELAEQPLHVELAAPRDLAAVPVASGPAVLSPDGRKLAFVTLAGVGDLVIRDLSTGHVSVVEGAEGAGFPFWSPDGTSLGFFARGKLRIVRASGGGVQDIADAKAGRGGSWSSRGVILFAPDIDTPIMRVSIEGGPATPVTKTAGPGESHRNPLFLADGERFLYTARTQADAAGGIMAGSLSGDDPRQLVDHASNAAVHDGMILYFRGGNVVAQQFDERALSVRGSPVPVAEGVEYFNARDVANFSVSQAGSLLYRRASVRSAQPMWMGRDGRTLGTAGPEGNYRLARVSPDGRRILFAKTDQQTGMEDLWITDVDRGTSTKVTFESTNLIFGVFSRDGRRLAVAKTRSGAGATVWIQPVAGGPKQQVYDGKDPFMVTDWSPDGQFLAGAVQRGKTGFDLATLNLASGKLQSILAGPGEENHPTISPDGNLLAYTSNESGTLHVYVATYPEFSSKWQVSGESGGTPIWSADGSELFYFSAARVLTVPVRRSGGSWDFGAPQALPIETGTTTARAVAPDGRVLLVRAQPERTPFTLVTHWKKKLTSVPSEER
jgi:eukaryotic-like serine/threonine-protein kinase